MGYKETLRNELEKRAAKDKEEAENLKSAAWKGNQFLDEYNRHAKKVILPEFIAFRDMLLERNFESEAVFTEGHLVVLRYKTAPLGEAGEQWDCTMSFEANPDKCLVAYRVSGKALSRNTDVGLESITERFLDAELRTFAQGINHN